MKPAAKINPHRTAAHGLAFVVSLTVLLNGCGLMSAVPGVTGEWAVLVDDVREYERRIGFTETHNFAALSKDMDSYPYCGYASRLTLPYSYQDPAIQWLEPATDEGCRALGRDADTFFRAAEAWGEVATPITASMLAGKLDRFIYLVIHEDCHDQFDLPLGVEEALCDLITHKAMAAFGAEKFALNSREQRAIRNYAETESRHARTTIGVYDQLAVLYARYERAEIASDALLRERSVIYRNAERPLAWTGSGLNNVGIANVMTYSRYYPYLESVFDALGRDLARTVALFKRVDELKPAPEDVMRTHGIADEHSVKFMREYEAAVLEATRAALAAELRSGNDGYR